LANIHAIRLSRLPYHHNVFDGWGVNYYKKRPHEETNHVEKVNDLLAREIDTSKCHKFQTVSKREGKSNNFDVYCMHVKND